MTTRKKAKAQGQQVDFELHTLGWRAFEDLCLTIVSEVFDKESIKLSYSRDMGQDIVFYTKEDKGKEVKVVCQCKHSSNQNESFNENIIDAELKKMKKIENLGSYYFFTNMTVTGPKYKYFQQRIEQDFGIKNAKIYGKAKIARVIVENKRLRQLVPRIYGLGDLSQILDERAYEQAEIMLRELDDDYRSFVATKSFKDSVKILLKKNIVFLLGEPMVGKSTIAKMLFLSMIDNDYYNPIVAHKLEDIKTHWNPNEQQLFWFDDVFGSTRFDYNRNNLINELLRYIDLIRKKGSKIILTSRTYIFNQAKEYLKERGVSLLDESNIVVDVHNLTDEERKYLLYNHLKYGDQDISFKSKIKKYLGEVAEKQEILPEIARRLGKKEFTENLTISLWGISDFFEKPKEYLKGVIEKLSAMERAALVLVFAHENKLMCPVEYSDEDKEIIRQICTQDTLAYTVFENLRGDFLRLNTGRQQYWYFRHPTLMEAISDHLFGIPGLLKIYVSKAPLKNVLGYMACEGSKRSADRMILPEKLYDNLINRFNSSISDDEKRRMYYFLGFNSDDDFLKKYLSINPNLIKDYGLAIDSYHDNPIVEIASRLNKINMLTAEIRLQLFDYFLISCTMGPYFSYLNEQIIKDILQPDLYGRFESNVIEEVISYYQSIVDSLTSTAKDDILYYIDVLEEAKSEFLYIIVKYESNCELISAANSAIELLDEEIDETHNKETIYQSKYEEEMYNHYRDGYVFYSDHSNEMITSTTALSIFDDLDQ